MKFLSKTTLALLASAGLVSGLFCQQAAAVPITGAVSFIGSGSANQSGSGASATTTVMFNNPFTVTGGSGSYAGTFGSSATFTNFSFTGNGNFNNATLVGGPIVNEWTFMSGGRTYSFDLSSIDPSNSTANASSISLQGFGTLRISGSGPTFDATAGSFALSGSGNNFQFTFLNASSSATVPDGGSTVALLGAALMCVAGLHKLLAQKAA